ncbi:MAG: hypothetical protein QOE29_153 [Gaiellaceae bacterium]|nr:hypothetical protein [Gaiellaceae bacterium]
MRAPRIAATLGLIALVIPAAASSSLASAPSRTASARLSAPLGLKGFLLNYAEPTRHVFPTEPAFAWSPSPNAQHYEFQLARSSSFRESSIVYENDALPSPTSSVPVTLPWTTGSGSGYGFQARARAVTQNGTTPWSAAFGFNVRWPNIPTPLPSQDGLLRWTPVVGASGYEVWEMGITGTGATQIFDKWVFTQTNVLDERDWYTFHAGQSADTSWYKTIHWRVRAVRVTSLVPTKNDSPRSSMGPWSPVYTTVNGARPVAPTALALGQTLSDVVGTTAAPAAHGSMPGFTWSGNRGLTGGKQELYRTYVFSDQDCLNPVYVGAVVGSPAYAPRISGPLALPATQTEIAAARTTVLANGSEGQALSFDDEPIVASESLNPNKAAVDPLDPKNVNLTPDVDPNLPDPTTAVTGTTTGPTVDPTSISVDTKWVNLWDTDWPSNGYYWTVVPVVATSPRAYSTTLVSGAVVGGTTIIVSGLGLQAGDSISIGSGGPTEEANSVASISGSVVTLGSPLQKNHGAGELIVRNSALEYQETELWQDACAAGRVGRFGKISQPVVTGGAKPFISGLTTNGSVVAGGTTRTFYGVPVIAWQPALGADEYQIQWSRTEYPFEPALTKIAPGTSTLMSSKAIGFKPGTYYYRVRGLDFQLPKNARAMGWSKVQKVVIAAPVFTVDG